MIYAINYDLKKPGQDYTELHEAIKACGTWWHYLGSTWLVDTSLSAAGIWQKLAPHVDKNDRVLVIGVTFALSNLIVDVLYMLIDPRIRL